MVSTWEPNRSTSQPRPYDDDAVPTEPNYTRTAFSHSRSENPNVDANYPGVTTDSPGNGDTHLEFGISDGREWVQQRTTDVEAAETEKTISAGKQIHVLQNKFGQIRFRLCQCHCVT